ncbi:type IX secretion system membrane protein PorP/SprF [Cytophagaceae bacterium ABcell3]|nr:type IX secretion system membrane protein PorP/SprF [Cytophagaceae bacterium ABcell3]
MKFRLSLVLLLASFFLPEKVKGQDIQFSQFYAASPYLNPGFAGSAHQTRGIFHQRLQWPRLEARYITSYFSADTYFDTYKSGVGFYAIRDIQGDNTISSNEVAAMYSYELHILDNLSFRPGVQLTYISRLLNYSNLYFSNQIDDMGNIYLNNTGNPMTHFISVASGGILYSDRFWFGYSSHHMNNPNQSFIGEESRLPVKHSFVGGYKFMLNKSRAGSYQSNKTVSITPTFQYKFQGRSDQVDLGIYAMYDQLIAGFWYRGIPWLKRYLPNLQNNESAIVLVGWKFQSISITYSYDFTVSRLSPAQTGGSHELNITYLHQGFRKKKKQKRIPCPKF